MNESATTLKALNQLVGGWTTEATHPALPGVTVRGTAAVEWLEGERFLIMRSSNDHPDFPDSISIIGFMGRDRVGKGTEAPAEALHMYYFDSRGVFRDLEASIDQQSWRVWRLAPGFSQRFTGTIADGGHTIDGLWQMNQDGDNWNDDLRITYRRHS